MRPPPENRGGRFRFGMGTWGGAMGAIYSSDGSSKPVFRNPDELVDWIVQRLEQPQVSPEAADVAVAEEPEPRNDWERIDWIMRRLNKPEDTSAVSPWSDNPDNFDALEQPSRIDAQAMAPIYEQLGFTPNGNARNMANWQTQALASLPRDPVAKIRVFARNRFPDLSPDDALGRYGVMGDRIFYIDRDGSAKWEEPAFSAVVSAPLLYAGYQAGPSMAVAGAGAGAAVFGVPGAAAGAGISDAARQYLAAMLAHEEMSFPQRAIHVGMEAMAGGVGRYAGDRIVRAMMPQQPGWAYGASPIAQWGVRKATNNAAFRAGRAIQDQWTKGEPRSGESIAP